MLRAVTAITLLMLGALLASDGAAQAVRTCSEFDSQPAAQSAFQSDPEVFSDLDKNQDGVACEPFLDVPDSDKDGDIDDLDLGFQSLISAPMPTPRPTPEIFLPADNWSLDDEIRLGLIPEIPTSSLYAVDSPPPTCDSIGFSVPQELASRTDYLSFDQKAYYWSCSLLLSHETTCTNPFSYEHPTDRTLSTLPGLWVAVCSVYFFVGDNAGVVADPEDFSLVDAQAQRFAFRPFPILIDGMDSEMLEKETYEPGAVASGFVTFTGGWSDLDPDLDYPLHLEWSPEFGLLLNPDGMVFGDYGTYDRVELGVTSFTIIEEPFPAMVIQSDELTSYAALETPSTIESDYYADYGPTITSDYLASYEATEVPSTGTKTGSTSYFDQYGSCDLAYPDERTCIPPGPPFNQGCAVTSERNFTVLPPDPQQLDTDGDGIGCKPVP